MDQQVWLEGTHLHTTHPTTKLHAKRFGPFKILEVLSPVTYCLELLTSWKIHNAFHAATLHPYKEMEFHGPNFLEPLPDLVDGHEEWEVDGVLALRQLGRTKVLQYLVKWKGFSEAYNSWEPRANLGNASALVKEFHDKNPHAIRHIKTSPSDMGSSPLPDISSLTIQFGELSLMSQPTSYPSPTDSERRAILAVDTETVAQLVSDMYRANHDTPPPIFPREPDYAPLNTPLPEIDFSEYLRMSPSLVSIHGTFRPSTLPTLEPWAATPESPAPLPVPFRFRPLNIPAAFHPSPRDNPNDPQNLIVGVTDEERERMFYLVQGLRDTTVMVMQQQEAVEATVANNEPRPPRPEIPSTSPSSESSITLPTHSHVSLHIDKEDEQQNHPGEDWIAFNSACHHTSINIPASEAHPDETIPARYVRYHVYPIMGEPTISSTMGIGRPIYGEPLQAAPDPEPNPANYRDHRNFLEFEEQHMISGPFVRALEDLGDHGLVGDVIRYRGLTTERRCLAALRQEVEALEDFARQRRARFMSASQALGVKEATIR